MAKRGQVQLQADIQTDDDMEKLIQKPGVILIDVYSNWCGNCSSMMGILRKLKLEVGGDDLILAAAKSDEIEVLKRFREHSEPTWLFVENRKLVRILFGANAPQLSKFTIEELKKYRAIRDGAMERGEGLELDEVTEEEKLRSASSEKLAMQEALILAKKRAAEKNERLLKTCENILEIHEHAGILLALPYSRDSIIEALKDEIEPQHLRIARQDRVTLTKEDILEMLYFSTWQCPEDILEEMVAEPCMVVMLEYKGDDSVEIDEYLLKWAFGDMKQPKGSPDSFAQRLLYFIEKKAAEAKAALTPKTIYPSIALMSAPEIFNEEGGEEGRTEGETSQIGIKHL